MANTELGSSQAEDRWPNLGSSQRERFPGVKPPRGAGRVSAVFSVSGAAVESPPDLEVAQDGDLIQVTEIYDAFVVQKKS